MKGCEGGEGKGADGGKSVCGCLLLAQASLRQFIPL